MSISSMHGRFPFFSLGTSAKYFKEKNKFYQFKIYVYENILVYVSYKMRAISLVNMLKVLNIQMSHFCPEV